MVNADNDALHEALSAVMDGRATPADWERVNAAWASDPALRERWALWHAAADGLRSTELTRVHRDPEGLLAGIHAHLATAEGGPLRRRDWWAPLAVAAGFVCLALGLSLLRPEAQPEPLVAAAPLATAPLQGLGGLSFAQTAAGRTLVDSPSELIDWNLRLPEPAASQARP